MANHSDSTKENCYKGHNNSGNFGQDNYFNRADQHGNVPLHTAVIQNDIQQLKWLLKQKGVKIDHKNHEGETPLLMSLWLDRSDDFIMQLIDAGCDRNASNIFGQTPLHIAIYQARGAIAVQLLKRGANVDSQDNEKCTPLRYAVERNCCETVCMLLYYNADVTLLCNRGFSPFTYALFLDRLDLANILFDYYDGFPANSDGFTALHLATLCRNPLALTLIKAGEDVNCVTHNGESAFVFSLQYEQSHVFELMWPLLHHQILLKSREPFLWTYIKSCHFSTSEWLKCLYLILESPIAFSLFEHCRSYINNEGLECGFFWELLHAFNRKNVKLQHRVAIINICLSFGQEVNIRDINLALEFYGTNEELEAFIHIADYSPQLYDDHSYGIPLLTFIFAREEDCTRDIMIQLLQRRIIHKCYIPELDTVRSIVTSLGYFAIPVHLKQKLAEFCRRRLHKYKPIVEKLETVPEIPLLLELSRNVVRRLIKQTHKIESPYQFQSAVKKLCLPHRIKDIICFKTPLY